MLINLLLQLLDCGSVFLLAEDVVLLLENEVLAVGHGLSPLLLVLLEDFVVVLLPVLGANFNGQVLILNFTVFDELGRLRRDEQRCSQRTFVVVRVALKIRQNLRLVLGELYTI